MKNRRMNEDLATLQLISQQTASRSDRYRESTVLISEKINNAFNKQIGHELGNSIQYLAIATHFQRITVRAGEALLCAG